MCNILKCIGKVLRASGAEKVVTASNICREGTTNKVFASGEDYYQAMRVHKILQAAMTFLHIEQFEVWCIQNNISTAYFDEATTYLSEIIDMINSEDKLPLSLQRNEAMAEIISLEKQYDNLCKDYPTHTYWTQYIKMVDILSADTFLVVVDIKKVYL